VLFSRETPGFLRSFIAFEGEDEGEEQSWEVVGKLVQVVGN